MQLYVIRRNSIWAVEKEREAPGAESTRVGAEMADQTRWIRSYAVKEDDLRIGSVCIYEAIREHRRRIGAYTDDFQRVMTTAVVRDDPGESG